MSDLGQRHTRRDDVTERAAETARENASLGVGSIATAAVSIAALIMSAISLYQTVLKQARIQLFVPETISYTRDPNGSYEVFVVPVTLVNSGARDGVVSKLSLKVKNNETGRTRVFDATFLADQGYFSTKEDVTKGLTRPKAAFAPMTAAGRSSVAGTLLFYPRQASRDKVLKKEGRFSFELSAKMKVVETYSGLDNFLAPKPIEPTRFVATMPKVPSYFAGYIMVGNAMRMFVEQ